MKTVKGLAHRKRSKKGARANSKRKAKLQRARKRNTRGTRSTYR